MRNLDSRGGKAALGVRAGPVDGGRGAAADHAARRRAVQRRPPVQQGAARFQELTVKYYGKPVIFVLHRNSELGLEKDYFAYMNQGISVDYGDRLAGAHVDVRESGAAARHAVPVPRPRPLEQGARLRRVPADRRRRLEEGRRDDHRLRRRRHAQHHRQQAGAQHGRVEGPVDARDGRADPDADVQRDRREAVGDRLQRGLQRNPDRRDPGRPRTRRPASRR